MLKQITDNVFIHQSDFLQSNAVIVRGPAGMLLIDPGITSADMQTLADDLHELGQPVIVGYSTHPHWDHLLWDAAFGAVPRYSTARGEAEINDFFSSADWRTQIIPLLPSDLADQIPINDVFGKVTGLPATTSYIPWDGPKVRIIEHQGHAAGSAALLIEDEGVLVAGDMLSDILTPFFELDAPDPIADYLEALELLERRADSIRFVIPGHGSVGAEADIRVRLAQDKAYVAALRDGQAVNDARLTTGPQKDLLATVHAWQAQQIAARPPKQ